MRRILLAVLIVAATSTVAFRLTKAFFSDTEISTGNIFQAGTLDLKVDNTSYYNGQLSADTTWQTLSDLPGHLFFNFLDVKPGDNGEDTISLHVQNDAWACMDIKLTKNDDNTCTTPEKIDDPTCNEPNGNLLDGELAQNIHFVFWADDGDNVFETGEQIIKQGTANTLFDGQIWTLADSTSSIWSPFGPLPANQTKYIGKYWCLGNLSLAPVAPGAGNPTVNSGFTCDGSQLNNATQTDIVMADVEFTAIQARNNPNFKCNPVPTPTPSPTPTPTTSPTPSPTPTPTPVACVTRFADSVVTSSQGTRKDGTAVLANRSDPTQALVAQSTGAAFDSPVIDGTFFSLGFKIGQPANGSIVVKFNSPVLNGTGDDLRIYEVTGGPPYPDEKVKVEASPDNITYTQLTASLTKDGTVDLGILPSAQYVRLTDVSDINLFEPIADAYDVDGVQALCPPGQ